MNPDLRILILVLGLLHTTPLWASSEVKDVPTRAGVTQRLLLLKPDRPLAVLLVFAGGERPLGIGRDGSLAWGSASLLIRISPMFVRNNFAIAIADFPSDQLKSPGSHFREGEEHTKDIAAIIAYLRKDSGLPVWLIGTGSGTTSVLNAAVRLEKNGADGIVLTSGIDNEYSAIFEQNLGKVRIPTLTVRKSDSCLADQHPEPSGGIEAFKNSPKAEELTISAPVAAGSDPCLALPSHGYLGLEDQLVDKISNWIRAIALPASFI